MLDKSAWFILLLWLICCTCSLQKKKKNEHAILTRCFVEFICAIGLASDDVTKLCNAWQRGKLVLNAPYKSMLGEKSLTWRSSLFLLGEIGTVLTTPSRLSASHFKRSRGSDKCGAVFWSIDALPACFCMGRYLCLEPILAVATPVAALWHSTCKPYDVMQHVSTPFPAIPGSNSTWTFGCIGQKSEGLRNKLQCVLRNGSIELASL